MIFEVSGVEVGSNNRLKIDAKMESKLECLVALIFDGFWCQFGSILDKKNRSTVHPKSIPRGIQKMIEILIDFLTILAPFWEPSWSHVGHFFRAKTPQDAFWGVFWPSWVPSRHPKMPQDAPRCPKTPPDLDFDQFLIDFSLIFGPFWHDF